MQTRAQKRKQMPELVKQLQDRLYALEKEKTKMVALDTCNVDAPINLPTPKKRKTNALCSSLTPQFPKPRTSTLNVVETSEKSSKIKSNVVKRVTLRRTLQYTSSTRPEPVEDFQSILQRICSGQKLHAPSLIVGREKEHQIVREVLQGSERQNGSLFIIGPPGTGKSSSVSELLLEQGFEVVGNDVTTLKHNQAKTSIKVAVKLNCSTFMDPVALYAAVAQQVKKATNWEVPEKLDPFEMDEFLALQRCGSRHTKQMLVVVFDEVDQLLRLSVRMQPTVKEVLCFFVRWAAAVPHNVMFLGIMNGVDMYHQVSRIHVTRDSAIDSHVPRVIFGSYSHQNLLLIMKSYVQSARSSKMESSEVSSLIEPRALEFIARKVAARDGDARLAISLLQQSARHALQRFSSSETISAASTQVKVTMRDVFQCVASMLSSPVIQKLKQLPRQAKLLLYVITALSPSSNGSDDKNNTKGMLQPCDMHKVSEELARLRDLPQTAWVPRLSRDELQTLLMSLGCYALIRQGGGKRGEKTLRPAAVMSTRAFWSTKLYSCVTMTEISGALQDDTSLSKLLL
ncbi:unnamed protein product [Peronospora farinosa]|uniref:Orc1-like AAA ATPase domain-containing protein n=1 Tax=Peronospora farinosa TaxID=134698 RepID=A0AAV0U319_9STRA|nr:unnamed protein product [Peronospora farinosa]CAI5729273.1 unnamed protein product [Peronospora farinosa]